MIKYLLVTNKLKFFWYNEMLKLIFCPKKIHELETNEFVRLATKQVKEKAEK